MQTARVAGWFVATMLAACGPGASLPNSADVDWLTSVPEAFQTAQQKNRMVLIAFVGSDWSVASENAISDILSTQTFKNFADNNLVLLKIDFLRKGGTSELAASNANWARMVEVDSLPTFVLVDPRGGSPTRIWQGAGYSAGGPEAFIQVLASAIMQRQQVVAQQGLPGPAGQPPMLPGTNQNPGGPGLSGMPSAQDLMRQQMTQAPQLPTSQSSSGLVPPNMPAGAPSNLPPPDQLMQQVRPTSAVPGPVMSGMPSPADLMNQVKPTPTPTGPAAPGPTATPPSQPAAPGTSAPPADTTQLMFNLK